MVNICTAFCIFRTCIFVPHVCSYESYEFKNKLPLLPFMFRWPWISTYAWNENQLYALFIFSLFCPSTSTCFGHTYSPSSGGIMYIYIKRINCCMQIYIYIYMCVCIYSKPPEDGLQKCPKHVKVYWRNKLRINIVSSWFSLHGQLLLNFRWTCIIINSYNKTN